MKALILAAGLGTRLAPLTSNCPKSLVEVNGKPILLKQIENLHKYGIYDITIVAGYKSEILINKIKSLFPSINIIKSENYQTTNNMFSAYLAKHDFYGSPFLMMNADVFFGDSIIKDLLTIESKNAIAVEFGRYLEESMKVKVESNKITEISKKISAKDAFGTSIDIYKFSEDGSKAFFDKCKEYIEDKKQLNLWSEFALNDILGYINFVPCSIHDNWVEIDNFDDLKEAERIFKVN